MIKNLACIVLLSGISIGAFSQAATTTKKTTARPDIPGAFVLELGLNRALSAPSEFKQGLWGSRTINFYYQYEFRILKSQFSFVPGVGFSLERYKLTNNYVLDYTSTNATTPSLIPPGNTGIPNIKRSQIITNYFEVPLELRWTLNPEDPARSFKVGVGGRVGYLFDSFTKVKYSENGETKKFKDKQDFNLNKFRYGITGRIGIGNFSLFGYYNLTPLFEKDKGLKDANSSTFNNFSTMTIGISLASF
ncbi:Outer membrane protein beta-barrel domain-containing protein [Chryseolinea serpens]|uniref:Outer membrane protein beta-barrel domain-containing protein n=1 Tax=Chryseolinea serpens TaxID=947013 RepID=A0A1M5UV81_9BACT|nr:porin family protein [Chryseolinea serpens]SHH66885.1 Outer membrane protein beta-barrel domain-containing protein [Chryseolinea serpens]